MLYLDEDDDVEDAAGGAFAPRIARPRDHDVALLRLESIPERVGDLRLVLHDQHAHVRVPLARQSSGTYCSWHARQAP